MHPTVQRRHRLADSRALRGVRERSLAPKLWRDHVKARAVRRAMPSLGLCVERSFSKEHASNKTDTPLAPAPLEPGN